MMKNKDLENKVEANVLATYVKKRSDKLINYFLTGYFFAGLVFAVFYDTWLIAFGVGGFMFNSILFM